MSSFNRWWLRSIAACTLAVCVGCPSNGPDPDVTPSDNGSPQGQGSGTRPPVPDKPDDPPPPPPEVPEVHMTEALMETCLVFIDDSIPEGELADADGNPQSLEDLFGEKLTVVLFWTSGESMMAKMSATSALEDLEKDIAEPYAEKGVKVVGISVNNTPEVAAEHITESGATFTNLHDPEGTFFAKVATEKLPRTYLVSPDGKIIWFDLEYSRASRRNLLQAIQVTLGEI